MLNPTDRELLGVVAGKLNRLRESLFKDITEGELRDNICGNLRFLLVDDNYQIAWDRIGHPRKITIRATDVKKWNNGASLDSCDFMQAAGVTASYSTLSGLRVVNRALSGEEVRERCAQWKASGEITNFTIKQFLNSPCIASKGVIATRQQVIQYVAYRMGGVHFDRMRNRQDKNWIAFKMLDGLRTGDERFEVFRHNPVCAELWAIGQSLVASDDCGTFLHRAAEIGLT